jgi:integrase
MARPRKPWFRKRRGDWCVTIDGKQVHLAYGRENKAAAVKEYHRQMAERDEPDSADRPATVAALLARFLGWSKAHKAAATYEQRRHFLKSLAASPGVSKLPPHKLTVSHVERWLAAHPSWTSSRRHAILIVLRAFNWAVKRRIMSANPILGIEVPRQKRVLAYLKKEQRRAVFEGTRDAAFRNFLTALEQTGCRPGEVRAVTAADVDRGRWVWELKDHKTAGKTGKPRTIFLTVTMRDLTTELMARNPTGPLFLNSRKRPWTRNAVRCRFRKLRERFPEFGHFTATSFRRAYVTDALENGVDVAKVAELVGHTSTDMVMRFYNQLQERTEHMREMAERAAG